MTTLAVGLAAALDLHRAIGDDDLLLRTVEALGRTFAAHRDLKPANVTGRDHTADPEVLALMERLEAREGSACGAARAAGLDHSVWSKVKRGRAKPSAAVLSKIRAAAASGASRKPRAPRPAVRHEAQAEPPAADQEEGPASAA